MKRNIADTVHQSLIMGLCTAGCYGVADNLAISPVGFWGSFLGCMVIAFVLVKTFRPSKPEEKPVYDDFGQNNKTVYLKRMNHIKRWADRHFESAKLHSKSLEYRESVVVPTEELLNIWDISDKIIQDTIVPSDRY